MWISYWFRARFPRSLFEGSAGTHGGCRWRVPFARRFTMTRFDVASLMAGLLMVGGFSACAHVEQQSGPVARGRECPVALRNARVQIRHQPDAVVVRVASTPEVPTHAIAVHAEYLAEALSRHPETTVGAAAEVRPAPGKRVLVAHLEDAVELAFTSSGSFGFERLRRRVDERVAQWQQGRCPTIDHTLTRSKDEALAEARP